MHQCSMELMAKPERVSHQPWGGGGGITYEVGCGLMNGRNYAASNPTRTPFSARSRGVHRAAQSPTILVHCLPLASPHHLVSSRVSPVTTITGLICLPCWYLLTSHRTDPRLYNQFPRDRTLAAVPRVEPLLPRLRRNREAVPNRPWWWCWRRWRWQQRQQFSHSRGGEGRGGGRRPGATTGDFVIVYCVWCHGRRGSRRGCWWGARRGRRELVCRENKTAISLLRSLYPVGTACASRCQIRFKIELRQATFVNAVECLVRTMHITQRFRGLIKALRHVPMKTEGR